MTAEDMPPKEKRGIPWSRLAAALALMGAAKLLAGAFIGVPVLSLLAVTSVGFFAAGALFGWVGVGVAVATQAVYNLYYFGQAPWAWANLVPYAATGALGWAVFRWVPGIGRGFPNPATLKWFSLAAVLAGLMSSSFISLIGGGGLADIAIWARSTVVSLLLLTPPLLIAGSALLRRALAPIPDEVVRSGWFRVALLAEPEDDSGLEPPVAHSRPVDVARVGVQCLLATGVVMAGTVALGWGPALLWWNLLYMVPIAWAVTRLQLPGGLVAGGLVGLLSLVAHAMVIGAPEVASGVSVGLYGQVLLFWVFGALLGVAAERESHLIDGLVEVNTRLRGDLQRVVRALTSALEAKDQYTEGHLQRVNGYALEVGRRLGLGQRDLELLEIASALHDVGKIGIPEPILNKPGPLDEEEWEAMRRHPEIGARLLSSLEGLREAAPLVLHHQERWDGRTSGPFAGYPAGLRGEEIPLGARIIAVVDSFDAMTTDRPYRRALPETEARRVLVAGRGAQFDPRVVDIFLALLEESSWSTRH
jgi:hypothetical protein